MKLARVGEQGREQPALVDRDGRPRSLLGVVADLGPAELAPERLQQLATLDPADLPLIEGSPRWGVPVAGTRKLIAIGLNYRDHAAESGNPIPPEPVIFMKAITALGGPDDPVPMPRGSTKLDWEIELGVVIGSRARYVERADALGHVAGYTILNDLSEREHQLERAGTWDKGKGHDGFAPTGPWLVTPDELDFAQGLAMTLDVDGTRRQTGTTADMIFDVATIVAAVSSYLTLEPGDIIATGTPAGVALGMKPPAWLKVGDELALAIAGLGRQRHRIASSI